MSLRPNLSAVQSDVSAVPLPTVHGIGNIRAGAETRSSNSQVVHLHFSGQLKEEIISILPISASTTDGTTPVPAASGGSPVTVSASPSAAYPSGNTTLSANEDDAACLSALLRFEEVALDIISTGMELEQVLFLLDSLFLAEEEFLAYIRQEDVHICIHPPEIIMKGAKEAEIVSSPDPQPRLALTKLPQKDSEFPNDHTEPPIPQRFAYPSEMGNSLRQPPSTMELKDTTKKHVSFSPMTPPQEEDPLSEEPFTRAFYQNDKEASASVLVIDTKPQPPTSLRSRSSSSLHLPIPPRGTVKGELSGPSSRSMISEPIATIGFPTSVVETEDIVRRSFEPFLLPSFHTSSSIASKMQSSSVSSILGANFLPANTPSLSLPIPSAAPPTSLPPLLPFTLRRPSPWMRCQYMQVYTSLLCQFDCSPHFLPWIDRLVRLLTLVISRTNVERDAAFRSYACECLSELELRYPGLLSSLLDRRWRAGSHSITLSRIPSREDEKIHPFQLYLDDLILEETQYVREAYFSLYITVIQNCTLHLMEECNLSESLPHMLQTLQPIPFVYPTPPSVTPIPSSSSPLSAAALLSPTASFASENYIMHSGIFF
ncbi:hypothetical protein IE077_003491 [Cardiosporidium cionae]|uniref:Uncharacterized protein n=1 Tax=Cardiosporidium cionae TaxID=476202 RepID=A0ABQ7J890_9APIC|nr:hypothetical protein IE077_003491 [Cardiosporidium cionae]|eukprot:KAF8820154.1 hypothetical protein IE077_003491 [Cardiosporidium cionae]